MEERIKTLIETINEKDKIIKQMQSNIYKLNYSKIYCEKCGKRIKLCPKCGREITDSRRNICVSCDNYFIKL